MDCLIYHEFLYKPFSDSKYYTIDYNKSIHGIFLPLTKCYSPSCQFNHITCYSPLCPNKRISSLLHVVNNPQQLDSLHSRLNNKEQEVHIV